jgi:phage protein D
VSGKFDIYVGGAPATDLSATLAALEVEENLDMPGAFEMTLPVKRGTDSDLDTVDDPRLAPFANIAVVASASDGQAHCLIDGYVLSHRLHLDTGVVASTLKVWGQDASWLMDTAEQVKEWPDVTDGTIANTIFGTYGFTPDPDNTSDDSATYTDNPHSLMQRATDAQLLARLARRGGKYVRVFCTDTPGQRTGWFGVPSLSGEAVITLTLNDATAATIDAVDIDWDVMRPTTVNAYAALLSDTDPDGSGGATTDSGLAPLGDRDLATFAGQTVSAMLTTTADDAGTLTQRATAVLRDAGWFVSCRGTADAGRVGGILRAGTIVALAAAGALHSGNYLVWSVRHKITSEAHKMEFRLVRNALGTPPAGGTLPGAPS